MGRENKTRFAVLGLLAWQGGLSGYEVKRMYEDSASFVWSVSFGQIYPTLKQLEEEGLAVGSAQRAESRPERKVYEITDAGRHALHAWLVEETQPPAARNELMLKLIHGFRESPGAFIEHVERLRERTERSRQAREATVERVRPSWSQDGIRDAEPYWLLANRYAELMDAATAQWCDEALDALGRIETRGEKA